MALGYWFRCAAEQGDANSQFNLGVYYLKGFGVEKDVAEAVRWFRKAAEQGDAVAQCNLGSCYLAGCGIDEHGAYGIRAEIEPYDI